MKNSSINLKTHRNCKNCGNEFKLFRSTDKYCSQECKVSSEGYKEKKVYKAIPKVSEKRKVENLKYSVLRIEFLSKKENKICPITKQPTTEIHHKWSGKDRSKYFLDISTWLAVSRQGHIWIHENPKEARELGYLY
jgi:hypothetical protein